MTMISLRGERRTLLGRVRLKRFFFFLRKRKSFFFFRDLWISRFFRSAQRQLSAKLFVPPILPFNIIILLKKSIWDRLIYVSAYLWWHLFLQYFNFFVFFWINFLILCRRVFPIRLRWMNRGGGGGVGSSRTMMEWREKRFIYYEESKQTACRPI